MPAPSRNSPARGWARHDDCADRANPASASICTGRSARPSAPIATSISHVRHQPVDQERFAAAFATELATMRARTGPREVTSIFLGGGTPSLMKPETVGGRARRGGEELDGACRRRDHAGGQPVVGRGGALPRLSRGRRQPRLARRAGAERRRSQIPRPAAQRRRGAARRSDWRARSFRGCRST